MPHQLTSTTTSWSLRRHLCGVAAALALCMAAPSANAVSVPLPNPQRLAAEFSAWVDSFKLRAREQGFSADLLDRAFDGVEYNSRVVELDRFQPEFVRPVWQYLDRSVSTQRIIGGQSLEGELATELREIESDYGVPAKYLLAIWGIESAYGEQFGEFNVIEALSTLSFDGRRPAFSEGELLAALRIIAEESVDPQQLRGSWAGAMGHTQFIPSSYLKYAVDFDRDGSRDLWASNPGDALASAANYLVGHGWQPDATWGYEVQLPSDFDYNLAELTVRQPLASWQQLGVQRMDGQPFPPTPPDAEGSVIAPAGAAGPAFLVLDNFRVLLRYNYSTSYALAVAHLGDRIAQAPPFVGSWPRNDEPVRVDEIREMQSLLTELGYDTGGVDGITGPATRAAVRAFQESIGLRPDGYVSAQLVADIRRAATNR